MVLQDFKLLHMFLKFFTFRLREPTPTLCLQPLESENPPGIPFPLPLPRRRDRRCPARTHGGLLLWASQ